MAPSKISRVWAYNPVLSDTRAKLAELGVSLGSRLKPQEGPKGQGEASGPGKMGFLRHSEIYRDERCRAFAPTNEADMHAPHRPHSFAMRGPPPSLGSAR